MCLHTSICPSSASFSVVHTLPKCVCSDRKDTRPISKLICHTSICSSPATQDPNLHQYDTHMTNIYIDMTCIHVLIDCNTGPRSTSTPDLYLHRYDIHPYADRLQSCVFHLGAPYISTSHQYICLSTSMYICDIYLQRHDIHPYADRRRKGVCHLDLPYISTSAYLHGCRYVTHIYIDMTYIHMPIDYSQVSFTSVHHTSVHHISTSAYLHRCIYVTYIYIDERYIQMPIDMYHVKRELQKRDVSCQKRPTKETRRAIHRYADPL